MKLVSLIFLFSALFLTIFSKAEASPIYPAYGDFAPIILPGPYGVAPYPILAGGGYFGPPVHHHSDRYKGQESGGYSDKSVEYQKDSKYYYGGQYKGSCLEDGLYYKDDTTFVMCSNGYPHAQPCPPGTKTSGSPAYKPGYYYGYTDLCSVNLVDYGLGPEHYAPAGPPEEEKSEYSRGVSSSRVSYVSNHGSAKKHVQENYGGYDNKLVAKHPHGYYDVGNPHGHYDVTGYASYDDVNHGAVSQQSYHKKKYERSPGYHSPSSIHAIHSEYIVKSHGSGHGHHYTGGLGYKRPHGIGFYKGGYKGKKKQHGKAEGSEGGEEEGRSEERGEGSEERGEGSEERGSRSEERGEGSEERGEGSEERGEGSEERGEGSEERGSRNEERGEGRARGKPRRYEY